MRIGVMAMVMAVIVPVVMVGRVIFVGADALDMMVVALLAKADFVFEAQNLFAIFAHLAVHVVDAFEDFVRPIDETLHDQGLGVQI